MVYNLIVILDYIMDTGIQLSMTLYPIYSLYVHAWASINVCNITPKH